MHSLFDLSGQPALVTGASRGIGLAVAMALGEAGAKVILSSDEGAECEAQAAALRARGIDAQAVACDVTQRGQIDALVNSAVSMHGALDILVCNAGVAPHMGPIADASDADYELTMTVNLRSVLWLTSGVIAHMARRRSGSVVLMSSIAGVRGNKGLGLYGLSKAALAQLARNLAVEWGPSGIRVNALSPGLTRTAFAKPLTDDEALLHRRLALTPLRRIAHPEEIAGAALFLVSRAGGFVTGHNLIVDGGTTIGDGS